MTVRYLDTRFLTKAWVGASGAHARHQAKVFTHRIRPHFQLGNCIRSLGGLRWARQLALLRPGPQALARAPRASG